MEEIQEKAGPAGVRMEEIQEKAGPAGLRMEEIQEKAGPAGLRVVVDRALCIGAAECVVTAPAVFRLDARRRVVLLDPLAVDERTLWRAAESCPTDAIVLENEHGEQLYP